MSDKKISQLTASTTPLAGTEVLPVVQSGDTKQVSVANLTAGRDVAVNILDAASSVQIGSVSQNETHQYMLSNWNTVNEFATRITSDYFGKTKIATTTIPTGSDPSLGSYLDRLVISGDNVEVSRGNLVIGTSGKGIDFSADGSAAGMTSELLDDYEEGTWTPSLTVGGGSVTYTTQTGSYIKVGNLVTVQIEIVLDTVSTPSSFVSIGNPPFAMAGGFGSGAIAVDGMESTSVDSWECITRPIYNNFLIGAYISGNLNNSGAYLKAGSTIAITASYQV